MAEAIKSTASLSIKDNIGSVLFFDAALTVAHVKTAALECFDKDKAALRLQIDSHSSSAGLPDSHAIFATSKVATRLQKLSSFLKTKSTTKSPDFDDMVRNRVFSVP